MTVIHLGDQRYEGLTADTKPTNVPSGAIYRDTQLDIIYEYNGSSWDIIIGNTKTETETNKTLDTINNIIKNLGGYAYEVYTDGSVWYARNTKTGAITSTNASLTTVLQAAIGGLTSGRTYKEAVKVKGTGNIAKITIPSYTRLDLTDAKLTLIASTNDHMFVNSDTSGGNIQIEIIGGYIDGNNDGGQGTVGTGNEDLKNIIHLEKVTDAFVLYTYITDTVCRGIRLRDSENVIVAYNTINDTGAEGIQTRGGATNKILFNDVRNTGYSFITTYQTPNTLIHGNYCHTVISDTTSGINMSSMYTTVSNNKVYNNGNSTISFSEPTITYECSHSRILNNEVHGSRAGGGITGVGYPFVDLVISGNEVYNCDESGIRLSGKHKGIIITNNIVHDNQHSGINVGGVPTTDDPSAVIISNNICYNNGLGGGADVERAGIVIFGSSAAGIFDAIVSNNICYDTQGTKTQKYGIRAVNTDNCMITNNLVNGNLTDGMILTTNTNLVYYNNKGYASDNTVVTLTETQTLTNKTLTSPSMSGTLTIPGTVSTPLIIEKTAASGQDAILQIKISDDANSWLAIDNATGGDSSFVPSFTCKQGTTATAGLFIGQGTTDTGTQPMFIVRGRIGTSTAVSTRPVFAIENLSSSDRLMTWGTSTLTIRDPYNFVLGTTTGTKIGTATTQKLGFFNATPVVQPAANADTSGATLPNLEIEVNEIKALLRSLGLMA